MVENGYLKQERSPHDKRSVRVNATEKGLALWQAMDDMFHRHMAQMGPDTVSELDLMTAKLDLDVGEIAGEAACAETCPDVLDGQSGHPLGKLDGFSHRMLARRHVGDIAALHAPALALASAEHLQPPVVGQRADQRPDLRGADVERCNQGLISRHGHVLDQPSTV